MSCFQTMSCRYSISQLTLFVDTVLYSFGMKQEEYKARWLEMLSECCQLREKRNGLETELDEVKRQIEHLDAVLKHLGPLAGESEGDDISGLGLTDAIRAVLKKATDRVSPSDVRQTLQQKGFDLSGYSAPMSSIYKVLSRLAADDNSHVTREQEDNAVFYRWNEPDEYSQAAEISDDDIPF